MWLQSVRNNLALARNAQILIPDVLVTSCHKPALNNVSRSAASQAIPMAAFKFDLDVNGNTRGIESGNDKDKGPSNG